jgi:iron complex transport system substrate-binding protein
MNHIVRKVGFILLGVTALVGILTACSTSTSTPTPTLSSFTITDSLGRQITINNNHPQKIVSLAPSNTEILFALGLGDRIVGVTDYCDYPPEAKTKPSIGAYHEPNIEAIIAKEPDLVLATEAQTESIYNQLESHGITVVAIVPHNMNEVLQNITLVGKITGQDEQAANLVANMQKRINAITEKTKNLTEEQKLRVFYIFWQDPIWTAGAGTFEDTLIEMAGGINIAHALNGHISMSLEAIINANPQVYIAGIGMGTGEDAPLQYIKTEERLKDSEGVQKNRIYSVDMDIIGRPGPRIVDALEEFFKLIHPELQ